MSKKTIPNWSIFGTHNVGVALIRSVVPDEDREELDSEFWYSVSLDIMLDDGSDIEHEDDVKHISICLDTGGPTPHEALEGIVESVLTMFELVQEDILVMDEDGNIISTISMTELAEEIIQHDDLSEMKNTSGVLH